MIRNYNIIIIGGGPAGITAGIYSKYDGNNPLILEEKTLGWIPENHVNLLTKLEGFPGLLNTLDGTELINKFRHSLKEMGVDYIENRVVTSVIKKNEDFIVSTDKNVYVTNAIILATGTLPTKLSEAVVGDYHNYVHYFAYNNYSHYVGKDVVVLGSRNSGSTAAIYLAKKGLSVTILEIKPNVQAKYKHTSLFGELGIKVITNATITHLKGEHGILKTLFYQKNMKKYSVNCSAVFCYIGVTPNTIIAKQLGVRLDDQKYTISDFYQTTNVEGVFVAGDMCGDLKHIIAASGQGAKAAYNANKYLSTKSDT